MPQNANDQVIGYFFYNMHGEAIHCGITNNPDRREREHQRSRCSEGYLEPKTRWMSRAAGREWERNNSCSPYGDGPCCTVDDDDDDNHSALAAVGLFALGVVGVGLLAALLSSSD